MQTKIYLLNQRTFTNSAKSRSAFALIAAVFVMLLISIMLLKMLAYTADTSKRTVDEYLREQARLLTYSATEYAVLAVSGKDRSGGCITSITSTFPESGSSKIFDINTTIKYVWSDDTSLGADRLSNLPASCKGSNLLAQVKSPEEHGSLLIDVTVTSASSLGLDEPIRFHRRTLQKL
jgi:type II secretory pathway pseudopilin PulG